MAPTSALIPIEFRECMTDSPEFRKSLQNHEKELDRTGHAIKSLIKEIKCLVEAARSKYKLFYYGGMKAILTSI